MFETIALDRKHYRNLFNITIDANGIAKINTKEDQHLICAKQGSEIVGYRFDEKSDKWDPIWREKVFDSDGDLIKKRQAWLVTDVLGTKEDLIVVKNSAGINFYQQNGDRSKLSFLTRDGTFNDLHFSRDANSVLMIGRFYPDVNLLGAMMRINESLHFYVVDSKGVENRQPYPMWPMNKDINLAPIWTSTNAKIFSADLQRNEQDLFVLNLNNITEFYKFNDNYDMDLVIRVQMSGGTKRLFFANLTNQSYQDMIQLTDVGLYTYRHDKTSNSYLMINYNADFSKNRGWMDEYNDSIQILDLNTDDRDDLIFTGQSGITALYFDDNINSWKSLFNSDFRNYGTIAGAISRIHPANDNPFVFMNDIDGVYWSRIVQDFKINPETIQSSSSAITPSIRPQIKSTVLPKISTRSLQNEIPTLRWVDQWDDNFLKNAVSVGNGGVRFQLPLIDTSKADQSPLQLFLIYDSHYTESKRVGKGWTAIIGEEYIGVHRPSSYEKDNVYYLISSSYQSLMVTKTTGNELHFEIPDRNDKIVYELKNERWIIETDEYISIYGSCNDQKTIRWGWRWKYWQGPTRDNANLQKYPFAWYLCQKEHKKSSQITMYLYENDVETLPSGKTYTKGNRLVKVKSQYTTLIIEYAKKNNNEYENNYPLKEGIVQFPIKPSNSHYIQQCSVETSQYKQTFTFKYALGNHRLLTEIKQLHSDKYESLLKFEYQGGEQSLMTKAVSPFGLTAEFTYELRISNPKKYLEIKSYPTSKDLKFVRGSDYSIVAYPQSNRLIIQIYDSEMFKVSETSIEMAEKLESYHIQPYEESLVVLVLFKDSYKELLYYNRHNGTWSVQPKRNIFNKNVKINLGNSYVAVTDSQNHLITLYDIGNWNTAIVRNEFSDFIAESEHFIAAYDNTFLKIYWPDQGTWRVKKLRYLPNLASRGQSILKRFDLEDGISKILLYKHDEYFLQVADNAIMLNTLEERHHVLFLHVYIYLIDTENNLVYEDSFEIQKESIFDLEHSFEREGTTFTLQYVIDEGNYKIRYSNITGKLRNEIYENHRNKNRRKDALNDLLKSYNEYNDNVKALKGVFLLDWESYLLRLKREGIHFGDGTLHIGDKIHQSTRNQEEFKLGSNFILRPKNRTLTFFNTENRKLLDIDNPGGFINRYPDYIAYQKENTLSVLPFKEKTFDTTIYFNEKLLTGDNENLYTTDGNLLKIRPLSTFIPRQIDSVQTIALTDGKQRRLNIYKHTFNTNQTNKTYIESIRIIPTTKDYCGWYEIVSEYPLKGNATHTRNVFDKTGKLILQELHRDDPPNNSHPVSPGMLWDESGEWLISNFHPYNLSEEDAAYYGFESYEINRIGVSKKWNYNPKGVINGGFSMTGRNHLRLYSNTSFEGLIQPRNQFDTYLASCWLRTDSLLYINEATSLLKAKIFANGKEIVTLIGQAKRQSGFWFYVELVLNFKTIRDMYENYVDYFNEDADFNVLFGIKLIVSNDSQSFVDLDHIRFSPIVHEFEATSYSSSGKATSTLQNDGTISRAIFNIMDRRIAEIREDEQVGELTTISKSGRLPFTKSLSDKPCSLRFEPENGVHERFDESTWSDRWKIDDVSAWKIALGQLWHQNTNPHRITASSTVFDESSALLRLNYLLESSDAILKMFWSDEVLLISRKGNFASLTYKNTFNNLPVSGELIVMIEHSRLFVWLDAVLLIDQLGAKSWSKFGIEAEGHVLMENFITANRLHLEVQYFNAWMESSQMIQLEDERTVLVNEILYDEIGRPGITTKNTRIVSDRGLLIHRKGFANPEFVWNNGHLKGEVDDLNPKDEGYAYSRKEYEPNPLERKTAVGLPGRQFSTKGSFYQRFETDTDISFIRNHFPPDNFRYDVRIKPNNSQKIRIFDKDDNRIALYIRVPGYDHLLSTYEYDSEKRLVKILSPLYHEKVDTFSKVTEWKPGNDNLTNDEKQWQLLLGVHFEYDDKGEMIRKTTPDGGTIEFMHNSGGEQRFVINPSPGNINGTDVTYFDYDDRNQMIASGLVNDVLPADILKQYLDRPLPYNVAEYQRIFYSDEEYEPTLRRHLKRIITLNDKEPIVEELFYNGDNNVVEKNVITSLGNIDDSMDIIKRYEGRRLRTLIYPMSVNGREFQLVHSYNKLGQLKSLGTTDNHSYFAQFYYDANGLVSIENLRNFTRVYSYNSPGYLMKIQDPFLSEDIYYTEQGYGQEGFGDGIVMQTAFNATWTNHADWRQFVLKKSDVADKDEISELCIRALKRTGHITEKGIPIKTYNPNVELKMPVLCSGMTGYRLAKAVAARQPPQNYGHRYAYGNHQEMVKAKYYSQGSFTDPLTPDSFVKSLKIRPQQSRDLWKSLTDAGFIIKDTRRDDSIYGNRGKSLLRENELRSNLKDYIPYIDPIQKLLINAIGTQRSISLSEFQETFFHWDEGRSERGMSKQRAGDIYRILSENDYLKDNATSALNSEFKNAIKGFSHKLPDIVKDLAAHFDNALGENSFDSASYNIDANGNHRLFYTGFDRYAFDYIINRILSVNVRHYGEKEQRFPMQHDLRGNVVSALHRDIERIEYHPVSQKTTAIYMKDGRKISFTYDAKGERLSKRVMTPEGNLVHETKYIRDEEGRVLMDIRTDFPSDPHPIEEIATAYIYGPRGLLGFIRDDVFYNVTTDHSGSVRLIIKNGQVVAAYDYLPYGQMMRVYGNDKRSHIMYRFTGQEFDEETGLYNYHARLYDPEIGRFYQLDPQAQYFSPYMYAGNSPVSLVDPDGECAFEAIFLIIAIQLHMLLFALNPLMTTLATAGAYLGGAAANNRWNPAEWDFHDDATWLGITGGVIAGALAPAAIAASVASVGLIPTILAATVTGYMSTAATTGEWDPLKWKWDRPEMWSALFEGIFDGPGMLAGFSSMKKFAHIRKFGKLKKFAFYGSSIGIGVGVMYLNGVAASGKKYNLKDWDISKPGIWYALINGFDVGSGWPQNVLELGRGVRKFYNNMKTLKTTIKTFKPTMMNILKSAVKSRKSPLYKIALATLAAYYMGSSANENSKEWKWNDEFGTYQGIINGIFMGKDALSHFKSRKKSKLKSNDLQSVRKSIKQRFLDAVRAQHKVIEETSIKLSEALRRKKKIQSIPELSRPADSFINVKVTDDVFKELVAILPELEKKLKKISLLEKDVERSIDFEKVIAEEAVSFLNCGKRRRRALNSGSSCKIKRNNNEDFGNMIMKFVENFGFMESFNSLLGKTPLIHATTTKTFFLNVIRGAVMSMGNNLQQNNGIRQMYASTIRNVPDSNMRIQQFMFIKNADDNGSTRIQIRTVADTSSESPQKGTLIQKWNDNKLTNLKSLNKAISDLNINRNDVQIDASLIIIERIKGDKSTVKIVDDIKSREGLKFSDLSSDDDVVLKRITDNNTGENLQKTIENFINEPDMNAKNSILKTFFEHVMDNFQSGRNILDTGNKVMEADLHGFVYGVLSMNCKKRFGLIVNVERIAGKGYSDLMLQWRRDSGGKLTWSSPPVITEFKSHAGKSGDKNPIDQIRNTGYMYNMSMKTIAEHVFVVGMNAITKDVVVENLPIPEYKGLTEELYKASKSSVTTAGLNVKEALKYLYFSYSNLANKGESNVYMSRLIMGEILGRGNVEKCYINIPDKAKSVTHILFRANVDGNSNWIMLNIREYSGGNDFPDRIPVPSDVNGPITRVDVKFDPKSSSNGWDRNTRIDMNNDNFFLREFDIKEMAPVHDTNNRFTESFDPTIVPREDFINSSSPQNIDLVNSWLDTMKTNAESFDRFIKSESDVQALFHGILMSYSIDIKNSHGNNDLTNHVKIFAEANFSVVGRTDIVVSIFQYNKNTDAVTEKFLISIECKYANDKNLTPEKLKEKMRAAIQQSINYNKNMKAVTDLPTVINVAVIYDKHNKILNYESKKINLKDGSIDDGFNRQQTEFGDIDRKRPIDLDDPDDSDLTAGMKRVRIDDSESRRRREAKFNSDFPNSTLNSHDIKDEKLNYWPIKMIKNVTSMINSTVGFIHNKPEQYNTTNPSHEGPTLLEMGDKWISTNDIQGNLTWALIVARKLFGGKPIETPVNESRYNIELEIQSAEIVEQFLDRLKRTAISCGVIVQVRQIIEQIDLRPLKKDIHNKLRRGLVNEIPQLLYDRILNHTVQKVASRSTKKQAEKFLRLITKDRTNIYNELMKRNDKYEMKNDRGGKRELFSNPNERSESRIYHGIKQIDHGFKQRHAIN